MNSVFSAPLRLCVRWLVLVLVLVATGAEARADAAYFYPRAMLQVDGCGTWAEDGNGGILWDSTGACWEGGGPVEFGYFGGGDVAWSAREINGPMTGKHWGAVALFEYLLTEDGLWLLVTDVAVPVDPGGGFGVPDDGTGDPGDGGCPTC